MVKKMTVWLLAFMIICIMGACQKSPEAKITGRWRLAEDSSSFLNRLEFFSDGTYVSNHANYEGSYSIDDNRIRLQGILVDTKSFTYQLKGDILTFYDDGGDVYCVYERVSEKEEIDEETELEATTEAEVDIKEYSGVISQFSEGKMWIGYQEGKESYTTCVDKTGHALFQFKEEDVILRENFSNGYAYLVYKGDFSVIDTTGKILSIYPEEDYGTVLAYGDGYTIAEGYVSNFDETFWHYTIYGPNAETITSFKVTNNGQVSKVNYCGEGVFAYKLGGDATYFYCVKEKKEISVDDANLMCKFDNGKALVKIEYADTSESGYRARLVFMTSKGKLSYVPIYPKWGWNWDDETVIKESMCILTWPFSDGVLVNYDIKANKFYMLDEYYTEKIDWEKFPANLTYSEGVIAVPLIGSDNENYIIVLDKKMKKVTEPIKCTSYTEYSDGRMILVSPEDTSVYNEKGEVVFTLSELGCQRIETFSEGIAIADDNKCIDISGNTVFEFNNIDNSNVITY